MNIDNSKFQSLPTLKLLNFPNLLTSIQLTFNQFLKDPTY